MKALFPKGCRALGFVILALSIFVPFILFFLGMVTDNNLSLIKACIKVLCIVGALLLFFSMRRFEGENIEKYRTKAVSVGLVLTLIYLVISLVYNLSIGNNAYTDSSSFLIFLILTDISLEYFVIKDGYNRTK